MLFFTTLSANFYKDYNINYSMIFHLFLYPICHSSFYISALDEIYIPSMSWIILSKIINLTIKVISFFDSLFYIFMYLYFVHFCFENGILNQRKLFHASEIGGSLTAIVWKCLSYIKVKYIFLKYDVILTDVRKGIVLQQVHPLFLNSYIFFKLYKSSFFYNYIIMLFLYYKLECNPHILYLFQLAGARNCSKIIFSLDIFPRKDLLFIIFNHL